MGLILKGSSTHKKTALFIACNQNNFEMVKHLIKKGANVNVVNDIGESCLMTSIDNIDLFQYLISMGADVNSIDAWGQTVLMQAIKSKRMGIIVFLLDLENIQVRLKNCFDENVLHLAIRNLARNVVKIIIKKAFYTKRELIKIYEQESCLFYSMNNQQKSENYWEKASELRSQLNFSRVSNKKLPTRKLKKVFGFSELDVSKLLYLESVNGLKNLSTLQAYTNVVLSVDQIDDYINLCQFYFDTVHFFDDRYFFGTVHQKEKLFIQYFHKDFSSKTSNMLKMFKMFEKDAIAIRTRLEGMTPTKRLSWLQIVECFSRITLVFLQKTLEHMPGKMFLFYEGIKRILNADIRLLNQKPFLQTCLHQPIEFLNLLCEAHVNVNSTDEEGKTILHKVLESHLPNKMEIVKLMIDNGFNFQLVTFNQYCLPCHMEKQGILPNPLENRTLQCLAARSFCEKTFDYYSDVPRHLKTIVNSHLFLS